jgi:hypothetical protein
MPKPKKPTTTTSNELATREETQIAEAMPAIEKALIGGDLAGLNPDQRLAYYYSVCKALSFNALTKPFIYITLNGKLCLYATKDCAEQLRRRDSVSVTILSATLSDDKSVYKVHARATMPSGRTDESIGALSAVYPERVKDNSGNWRDHPKAGKPITGEDLAGVCMKCETKAKRRVTMSICGLGIPSDDDISFDNGEPRIVGEVTQSQPLIQDRSEANELTAMKQMLADTERAATEAEARGDSKGAEDAYERAADLRQRITQVEAGEATTKDVRSEPKPEQPKAEEITADNWQEIRSHIGTAAGPIGKKLGDLMGPEISYARSTQWIGYFRDKLSKQRGHTKDDLRLMEGLTFAEKLLPEKRQREEAESQQKMADLASKADKTERTTKGQKKAEPQLDEPDEVETTLDWRNVIAPASIPNSAQFGGKRIKDLPNPRYIAAIKHQRTDKLDPEKLTKEEKLFVAAINLGYEEMSLYTDAGTPEKEKAKREASAKESLREKVQDLIIDEATFISRMKERTMIDTGEGPVGAKISDLSVDTVWDLLFNWPNIEAFMRDELNRLKK